MGTKIQIATLKCLWLHCDQVHFCAKKTLTDVISVCSLVVIWLGNKTNEMWKRKSTIVVVRKSKVIYPKYSKHWLSTMAHIIDCVCSKILNHGLNHGSFISFTFQAYTLPHTLNCICVNLFEFHIWILKLQLALDHFGAVKNVQ